MRVAFLLMVLIHGLIHLLGFVKAFGLNELKALTLPISKPMGFVWIVTTALFLIYGIFYYTNSKQAWLIGLLAVIVSQGLIFYFWTDAKLGTLPNMAILIVVLVGLGAHLIHSEFANRVKGDFTHNNTLPTEILTQEDIDHLPSAVQKYLHYTRSVGQAKVKNFRVELEGIMRSSPEDEYMKVKSVQYNFYQEPSRYFHMTALKMGLPATGLHLYHNGTATFEIKIMNWVKVVNAKGAKMNQGETVTLLNDMCIMAPATLIDHRLTWEEVDDTTVKVQYKNKEIVVSALLFFSDEGALINFVSDDRYETDGKSYINSTWATPLGAYQMVNGYQLATQGQLIYQRPEGEFVYGVLDIKSVSYNLSEIAEHDL